MIPRRMFYPLIVAVTGVVCTFHLASAQNARGEPYLASQGEIVYSDSFEEASRHWNYNNPIAHFHVTGGQLHVDTRDSTGTGTLVNVPARTLRNYIFILSVGFISADTSSLPHFAIFFGNSATIRYALNGNSRGSRSPITLELYRYVGTRRETARTCDLIPQSDGSMIQIMIKSYEGRLQIWVNENLCFERADTNVGESEFLIGAGGVAEVIYDDIVLVKLP